MPNIENKLIYLVIICTFLISACNPKSKAPDVSNINIQIEIQRFDHDLFAVDTTSMGNFIRSAEALKMKYPEFYDIYFINILQVPKSKQDTNFLSTIDLIVNNADFLALKHDIDSVFPNLNQQNNELTKAFKYYKYYFPDKSIPNVISYLADFQVGASTIGNTLALELDMFMGNGYRFYNSPQIDMPEYVQAKLTKAHIPTMLMKAWAMQEFPMDETTKTLLHKMIYNGKVLYFLDKVLPNTTDSIKIGYTAKQMAWANKYKSQIWADFMEQNVLYSTDELRYAKYLNDAPFTSGLSNDSAPLLGAYTGWQIVRQYMDNQPNTTLEELMNNNDSQLILKQSKYKPK